MAKTLRMGTRRSLLARAQSEAFAKQIEKCHPDVRVETIGIETQGDRITDVPLSKIEGKEFFVAELDQALINSEVDFVVHSLKDLSLDRPEAIQLACIPKRENPRDVILFHTGVVKRLQDGKPIRLGTSSPRRLENLPSFLKQALPRFREDRAPQLDWSEIRGNVNTRLGRIHLPEGDPQKLDGVVLAMAGINRLKGISEFEDLLKGIKWLVPPLSENPSAPGQGALAVECRSQDRDTFEILNSLHDKETSSAIKEERKVLQQYGGGCHQRFGATLVKVSNFGNLHFKKGKSSEEHGGVEIDEVLWSSRSKTVEPSPGESWNGSEFPFERELIEELDVPDRFSNLQIILYLFLTHRPGQRFGILIQDFRIEDFLHLGLKAGSVSQKGAIGLKHAVKT